MSRIKYQTEDYLTFKGYWSKRRGKVKISTPLSQMTIQCHFSRL